MDSDSSKLGAPVSKSQRKREALALQALGRRLIGLKPIQLAALPLSDDLREAIEAAQSITQRIARKREVQYVGKLLREVDVAPIETALEALEAPGVTERLRHRRLERWRDALVDRGDPVLQELLALRADADRSRLRRLMLDARREAGEARPPAASRQLFRVLRELDTREALPERASPAGTER